MHRTTISVGALFSAWLIGSNGLAAPSPHLPAPHPPATRPNAVIRAAAHAGPARAGIGGAQMHAAAAKPSLPRSISSVSVGAPNQGHLSHGVRVQTSSVLRISPEHSAGDVRYGVRSLVAMLERAATVVAKQRAGAVLTVGHLSLANGGEVAHHVSHESGRDADVAFYVQNARGGQLLANDYVAFRGDGEATGWPGARFDDASNWAFIAALLSDPEARVSHIFVAAPLRERLLAYARRVGAHPDLRERAAEVVAQPRGSLPHDDHFHVRISCPRNMTECVETPSLQHRAVAHAGSHTSHAGDRGGRQAGAAVHAGVARAAGHGPALASSGAHAQAAPARRPELQTSDDDLLGKLIGPKVEGLDSIIVPARANRAQGPAAPVVDDVDGVLAPLAPVVPVGDGDH